MSQFILDQLFVTQKSFLACQDAKILIKNASHFLSLTLQPKEIIFCIEADELHCLAQHKSGQPIRHLELSPTKLDSHISNHKLWELAGQKESLSAHLPITHMEISNDYGQFENWYCIKLQMFNQQGIFIFIQSPQIEAIHLWKTEPLLASMMMQFFYLLQKFRLNQQHKINLLKRDKQEALYLQDIELQQAFSSKVLQLHKMTLDLMASPNLDTLYKIAVETLREVLHFDRSCLILADAIQHTMNPTYGTDESGNTTDESAFVYDMEVLSPRMQHAVLHTDKLLEVVENTALYSAGKVVGIGWNAMVILRDGDNLIGWVAIDNLLRHRALKNHEQELLMLYSRMLSSAIIQKREEENIKLLHDSMVQLSSQRSQLDICRVAVEISRKKLNLDRVAVFLSYDNGKTMHGTFGTDINGKLTNESHFQGPLPKNSLLELAIDSPHQLAFKSAVPLYHENKIVGHGWNAAMLLRNQDQIIGFLVLDNLLNKRPLTSHNKHLLSLFSANLAEIISRRRAEESVYKLNNRLEHLVSERTEQLANANRELEKSNHKLAQLSLIDSLTGIANRRHFDDSYQKGWAMACRQQQNLSAIMLDVDHFKAYNDHYGHLQGDTCLKEIATIIKKHFRRAGELVARYGGEEFVILLSDVHSSNVNKRIQAVIEDLFNHNIIHKESPLQRITLSAGIATAIIHQEMPQNELLRLADEALYQAKSEGRNRLIISQHSSINSL
ncbi:sensor domain-containing diguanylate cyclase [Psychromonas hadalis]|uniref:sensor domain-containing diguanylate cyclase n=1 Tax=Psychromonas hadalis TaxID=211669 RepID=UPI0003B6906F|nr:sensor domain-containing diguanylate cyclase [Psychromonas hadalis]